MEKSETMVAASDELQVELEDVLDGIQTTAYRWDFASDRIDWAKNAGTVLGGIKIDALERGRAFALHIDPRYAADRYDGVRGGARPTPDASIPYALHYRFMPEGRRGKAAVWVEERGVCVTDAAGQPIRAQGTMRISNDRRRRERARLDAAPEAVSALPSRAELTGLISQLVSGNAGGDTKGAFLLVGVNDLNRINETYGYDVGDEVITIVGQRLNGAVRGRDCAGRFSSNKFGIVLRGCDADEAVSVARRTMAAVEGDVASTRSGAVPVSIFVGVLLLPDHAQSTQDAIGRAMQAVEMARVNPRERFYCYDPSSPREAQRKHSIAMADEVIRALNDRRIAIALQPVVSSGSHNAEFYECLLRLRQPDGSVMEAREFVPAAEELGLSKLIDHRALELAVELLRAVPTRKLALNVSALSTTDRHWIDALEALTGKDRKLTERLTVEITETAATSDMEATTEFVTALKQAGCRVALDDFGAGYASFRSLRNLGVDMVKIDGSFIENLGTNEKDAAFVQTLLDLAQRFGVETVGEWVGDERAADLLEKAGVSYMQGDFFGAPKLHEEKQVARRNSAG
ncbi:MAG: EAL domain-containing protein [Pseudomonadota bacterium]